MRVERGGGGSGVGAEIPLQPLKRTQATPAFHDLQSVRRTHSRAGAKCEEEGAAKRSSCGLSTAPLPHSLCCLTWGHRRVRSEGANFLLDKGVGGTERIYFIFCLCFSLSVYFLVASRLS